MLSSAGVLLSHDVSRWNAAWSHIFRQQRVLQKVLNSTSQSPSTLPIRIHTDINMDTEVELVFWGGGGVEGWRGRGGGEGGL